MMELVRRILSNEKGSALVMAIFVMMLLLTASGGYYVASNAGLSLGSGYSYANAAQYAAEAGARYVLAHAQENTPDATRVWSQAGLANTATTLSNGATFLATVQSVTAPTGVTGSYYMITSTGTVGGTTRVVRAYLNIPPPGQTIQVPVTTFDLLQSGRYSGNPWTIDNASGVARAPTDNQYYQVVFGDNVSASDGFSLNYNVNMKSLTDANANGYGIYYMVQGDPSSRDPNNMSAYVLQYDPGLNPDQILVKKVIAGRNSTTTPWANEVKCGTGNCDGPSLTVKDNNNRNITLDNQSFQQTKSPDNLTWSGTQLTNDLSNPANDQMVASFSKVLTKLGQLGRPNSMLNQNHQMTIDVHTVNGNVVHTIKMDGLEILKFIDRQGSTGGAQFTSGGTGLRVWNANVDFFNNTNGQTGQTIVASPIQIHSWGVKPN